jgi:hypothetical protein
MLRAGNLSREDEGCAVHTLGPDAHRLIKGDGWRRHVRRTLDNLKRQESAQAVQQAAIVGTPCMCSAAIRYASLMGPTGAWGGQG